MQKNGQTLSAYFKKGIKVADLINSPAGPPRSSNNFVEIAHALLTDSHLGAGELVGANAIGDMTIGAKFCEQNNFTWDGIISNKVNLREFLYEHATYNLLDFTVIGGKFNLIPAVPTDSNFKISVIVSITSFSKDFFLLSKRGDIVSRLIQINYYAPGDA